jgi:hypothetical protein
MSDQQLAVLLYQIARQIRHETYSIRAEIPQEKLEQFNPIRGLEGLAESLFQQAEHLRGGQYMSPTL